MTRNSKSQDSHSTETPKGQVSRFMEAARALECDESEERFDAALKKIAAHKSDERPKKRGKREAQAIRRVRYREPE
jgi:hypothetical protein